MNVLLMFALVIWNLHLPPKLSFSSKHIVTAIKLANIILTLQICVWSLFYYLSICVQNLSSQCCFLEIKMRFLLTRRLRFLARGCDVNIQPLIKNFFLNFESQKLQAVENSNFAQWSSCHLSIMCQNSKRFDKDLRVL